MWNLNFVTNKSAYKTEMDSEIENRLMVAKGEAGKGRIDWKFRIIRGKLVCIEYLNNKVLLYSIVLD